jgi:hypothetical protein
MKIGRYKWFGHPTMIAFQSWCHEAKIHHYSGCQGLWETLVQSCGFGMINIYVVQVRKLTWLQIPTAWKQRDKKQCHVVRQTMLNVEPFITWCYAPSNERHWGWLVGCSTCDSRNMENCLWTKWWGAQGNLQPYLCWNLIYTFPNLIMFKFMLKVLRKRSWISIYFNVVSSIWLTILLVFVDCRLVRS